jgi:hypothetical protein
MRQIYMESVAEMRVDHLGVKDVFASLRQR